MKFINLTKGKQAIVDDDMFNYLNQWKWHAAKGDKYAARREYFIGSKNKSRIIFMHRLIVNAPGGKEVDHIDGNGLDNRKDNLRIVTSQQNHFNHKRLSNNKSGYNGVSKTPFNTWHTCISVNGKTVHLGTFKDIKDAARAYNIAALQYFGEFSRLNQIEGVI